MSTREEREANLDRSGFTLVNRGAENRDNLENPHAHYIFNRLRAVAQDTGIRIGVLHSTGPIAPGAAIASKGDLPCDVLVVHGALPTNEALLSLNFRRENVDLLSLRNVAYACEGDLPYYRELETSRISGVSYGLGCYTDHLVYVPWSYVPPDGYEGELPSDHAEWIEEILTDVIKLANEGGVAEKVELEQQEALGVSITSILNARLHRSTLALEDEVTSLVADNNQRQRRIVTNQMRLAAIKPQIEGIKRANASAKDVLPEDVTLAIKNIYAMDHVVSVKPTVGDAMSFTVVTDQLPIECEYEGSSYYGIAGAFELLINFGEHPTIRVNNLTHRVGSYDHPHVSGGEWCLGGISGLMLSFIKDAEFVSCIGLAIDALQTCDPADAYTDNWRDWFEDVPNYDNEGDDYEGEE